MKKLLLINNYAADDEIGMRRIIRLKEIFDKVDGVEYDIQRFDELSSLDKYDMFILSGGLRDLTKKEVIDKFKDEMDIIRTTAKPVLGLCLGHQLMGVAFGFEIAMMERPELKKVIKLKIKPFELCDKEEMMVEENHMREIKYTPEIESVFDILSSSEDCRVQIIKHREKKLFGIEFHPETTKEELKGDGEAIIRRFLELV